MNISRRQFLTLTSALLASSCARVRIPLVNISPARFTVAAVNDIHLKDAGSTAILNRGLDKINALSDLKFSVMLGDLSSSGKLSEMNLAKDSLKRLTKPYFTLPGNHDVQGRDDIFANYTKVFGPTEWVHEEENWAFIGINSCEGGLSDVTIPQDRVAWLRKRIKKTGRKKPIAIFSHHPFNPNTKKYRVKNADEILGLFQGYNLKLVASGHWHGNQEEEKDGVLFTTTACLSSTRENFDDTQAKGFRLFHFEGETVKTEFVEVAL
jgi:3',5'-cyclic AMP phosphodiesterase CpdA